MFLNRVGTRRRNSDMLNTSESGWHMDVDAWHVGMGVPRFCCKRW